MEITPTNQNRLMNKQGNLCERLRRQSILLVNSCEDKKEFLINFMACWKILDLYGKKQENYNDIYKVFFECLQDMPGKKVNRAMKKYLKTNSKFPTPAKIREMVENYDYELTEKEQEYRLMHSRAKTRSLGEHLLNNVELHELESYEEKNGKINYKQDWGLSYEGYISHNKTEV
jgi:hypothetical protein